jgi:alpha-mannosidase
VRITSVLDTDLFVGSTATPRQVVRVALAGGRPEPLRVRLAGPLVRTPEPSLVPVGADDVVVEVGIAFAAPTSPGVVYPATVLVERADDGVVLSTMDTMVTAAETGWTMWMVSHFHYDPVWWNTQAGFTDTWLDLPGAQEKRMPFQLSAFDLVRAHLDAAREDEDYRFVLAEVDYLKPHWDAFPRDRRDLRGFIRDGRIELVGGNYNEANTNLTHPESTIRNAVHGVGYQRDVLGADPRSAWMLDVFGHDPAYPGLMADAGLDSSVWARGPWHHVGAKRHTGDITRMQFPSEFEWISPSGRGLLTAYLADHYVAGWDIERKSTVDEAMAEAYRQFSSLRRVAATRNVLLPVGHDHNVPSRFCTRIHREWNARYVWPRFVVGLPREFFAAVRADAAERSVTFSPQTRDMNPVYTGKDVSYIDTKQAQRAAEVSVLDGERVATLAWLLGARFPEEALDKAWRQLVYGAHHDAITGTESDQVYLDLVAGWREADELGREVLGGAVDHLASRVDTTGRGQAVIAVNTLSFTRDAVVSVTVRDLPAATRGVAVVDPRGEAVPAMSDAVRRDPDGAVVEVALTFLARRLPACGYRVYRVVDAESVPPSWTSVAVRPIENEFFEVEADPARGGALSRIRDRRAGRELVRDGGLAAEPVLQAEHPKHPVWEEGPWHLLPVGPGRGAGQAPADVRVETSPLGERIVSTTELGGLRITQHTVLWHGLSRVDTRCHVDGSIGQDHLLRMRFAFDLPGTLPVAEVGFAAVGRSFGFPDVDAAEHLWTLDSPAHTWAGLSSPVRLRLWRHDGRTEDHCVGVAELVADEDEQLVRELLVALAAKGVTATRTLPGGPRYGAPDVDSNLPDLRVAVAGTVFADAVLESAGEPYRQALSWHGRVFVPARLPRRELWKPGVDLRGPRALPVLIVARHGLDTLITDLADACVEVELPDGLAGTSEPAVDHSVAVVNRGTPGFVVAPDGTLHVSLMRSCSGWPCAVWIDGERRTVPDGSSFAWQHWSHTFDLSLVAGAGDWRQACFARAGQDVNHPVHARPVPSAPGDLPPELSLITVSPPQVLLTAAKPAGNALASGAVGPHTGVTVRVYETTGTPVTARVRLHGGLAAACRTNVLEENESEPLTVHNGRAKIGLAAADIATVRLTPATMPIDSGVRLARAREPVQPVFTRYWRHNAGPAPLGNLPVSVHINPGRLQLDPGGTAEARVTVSCSGRPASGAVELLTPPGLVVDPPVALCYDLVPDGFAEFRLTVRGTQPGRYLLAARIRDDLGQLLEDTSEVVVGARPSGDDLVSARLGVDVVELSAGEAVELPVLLENLAQSEIRGEAALISPYGTWADDVRIAPRIRPFAIAAGGTASISFTARAAATARGGSHWWALVRIACHGRLYYTPTVAVRVAT